MAENMKVKGFTVVPAKARKDRDSVQCLYLKKLEPRLGEVDPTKPPQRTVFVGNTPPWAMESDFEHAFKCCGKVEKVVLQQTPSRGTEEEEQMPSSCQKTHRVGYIIFRTSEAADKAMELPYHTPLIFRSEGVLHGLAKYKQEYLKSYTLDTEKLKTDIIEKVAEHDRKEKEREEAAKNPDPDEEGWVTVTRVGKNKGAPRTEAEDSRLKNKESGKRKRKELVNFYSFQNRERKRQRIEELRNKFQEDKSAIEKMRKERKFRPF